MRAPRRADRLFPTILLCLLALALAVSGRAEGAGPSDQAGIRRGFPGLFVDRDGKGDVFDPQWRKPVVLLINGGTRSGKEVFAHGFQTYRLGKIIGERSSGAVTAGRIIPLTDGSLFFMAVAGGTVDGTDLEGVGVRPDIEIPMPIPYLGGRVGRGRLPSHTPGDLQLARAIEVLAGTRTGWPDPATGETADHPHP